jgi:dienelactone hydrolase
MWVRLVLLAGFVTATASVAWPDDTEGRFLAFIRSEAKRLREQDRPPTSAEEWKTKQARLRTDLSKAWGDFPFEKVPLEAKKLGEIQKDGYRIERLLLPTMPDVWMPALAYVPDSPGKHPAILHVHGHWAGAKQDPHVQARCIGSVKHGFFVLAVDAFGAGERGLGKALGEYHGEMVAATLYPVGIPLSGIQVYENMRAVDYLQSRRDVDGAKIGVTGASGGGNQSMYAGAWDERLSASVPVCSVGNYQAYLGQACCMCEVVPGALTFTEEWGILGLTAPRGLMVVNATRDAIQFSVGEAKKSLVMTEKVYESFGQPGQLKHAVFESPHDYNSEMRQAMYGWMKKNLAGQGDGSPLSDPPMTLEEAEAIRCFPGNTRPDDWLTLPQFAAREGAKVLATVREKSSRQDLEARAAQFREQLKLPEKSAVNSEESLLGTPVATVHFRSEPGIDLTLQFQRGPKEDSPTAILLDIDEGQVQAAASPLARELSVAGYHVVTCDLRATGSLSVRGDKIGRAPDHNSGEWSLWIGRPLIGQWVADVRAIVAALKESEPKAAQNITLIGRGSAGLVALAAAPLLPEVKSVASVGGLASYVHPKPYEKTRLGLMLPGVLRDVGDVADIAGFVGDRRLLIADPVDGSGQPLTRESVEATFAITKTSLQTLGSTSPVQIEVGAEPSALVKLLKAAP